MIFQKKIRNESTCLLYVMKNFRFFCKNKKLLWIFEEMVIENSYQIQNML